MFFRLPELVIDTTFKTLLKNQTKPPKPMNRGMQQGV